MRARNIGLMFAMLTRIGLLFTLTWLMTLTAPLFSITAHEISSRDLILIGGGLFLIWKSVHEIHNSLEGPVGSEAGTAAVVTTTFGAVIAQIAVIDIVFSLDSMITAVGMVGELDHGHCDRDCGGGDAVFRGPHRRFCRPPSDDQDAGAVVPAPRWFRADWRGLGIAHPERLHLLCDGVLGGSSAFASTPHL